LGPASRSWIAGHRVSLLDPVFRWLTYLGTDGAIWLVLAAAVALSSRRWSILAWVALADVAAQVATGLIKLAVPRHRPGVETLVKEPHGHSFPSGHAASSFACAVVISAYAPRRRGSSYCRIPKLVWISRSAIRASSTVISAIKAIATQ